MQRACFQNFGSDSKPDSEWVRWEGGAGSVSSETRKTSAVLTFGARARRAKETRNTRRRSRGQPGTRVIGPMKSIFPSATPSWRKIEYAVVTWK